MKIDFHPAPQAAPRATQIWSHALVEVRLLARNGEQLLLALVIPVGLLVAGRFAGDRIGAGFATLMPSVLALAVWSTCFTSLAIATGFERRYGVLERLSATSLGPTGLLAGKALAVALITAGQVVLLAAIAFGLGWRPAHVHVAGILATPLAMAVFAALALAMAGSLRAEATLGLANLIYLAGLAGGVLVPVSSWPDSIATVLVLAPTAALGEALRQGTWLPVLTLLVWALGGGLLARKVFSWTS